MQSSFKRLHVHVCKYIVCSTGQFERKSNPLKLAEELHEIIHFIYIINMPMVRSCCSRVVHCTCIPSFFENYYVTQIQHIGTHVLPQMVLLDYYFYMYFVQYTVPHVERVSTTVTTNLSSLIYTLSVYPRTAAELGPETPFWPVLSPPARRPRRAVCSRAVSTTEPAHDGSTVPPFSASTTD